MVAWTTCTRGCEKQSVWINLEDRGSKSHFFVCEDRGWKQLGVRFGHVQFVISTRYLSGNNEQI